jgi:hypothetical protein
MCRPIQAEREGAQSPFVPPAERTRYYHVRPRRIPPEFCHDELLEECSVLAALLLTRVISIADDQGRLPGHPKYIRANAFGMRPTISERKVDVALGELTAAGFLIRYDIGGRQLLQVAGWFDLQGKWGQRRTYPSRYPAPPGWTADWISAGAADDEVRAPGTQLTGDVRPPSPTPSPSSSSLTVPGLPDATERSVDPERLGRLLEHARSGSLSDAEAMELGAVVASDELARARSQR